MRNSRDLVFSALFAALIVAGSYVRVPVGPVPIVLTSLFVLLSALLQKFRWAMVSIFIYLLLGAIGFPVFASGGGIAYFTGPTGGYLLGYLLATPVVNIISAERPESVFRDALSVVAGTLAIYLIGLPWLRDSLSLSWNETLATGILPFLPGDALKATIVYSVCLSLKRTYPELIPRTRARDKDT